MKAPGGAPTPPRNSVENLPALACKLINEAEDFVGFPSQQQYPKTGVDDHELSKDKGINPNPTENPQKNDDPDNLKIMECDNVYTRDSAKNSSTKPMKRPAEESCEENSTNADSQNNADTNNRINSTPVIQVDSEANNSHNQVKRNQINKFKEFDLADRGPYKIFLQNLGNTTERINPLLINRFLINKFRNRDVFDECYPIAANKVCIVAKELRTANEVLRLKEWAMDKKEVFIPNHLMTRQGVIRGVPKEFTEEEIKLNLVAIDTHFGTIPILEVRRFTRRTYNQDTGKADKIVPTETVQISFRGQYLPPRVRQCLRCSDFGHIKAYCKSSHELCLRCGEQAHTAESPYRRKELPPKCKNCQKEHIAIDKICEVRKQQQEIRDYATENNITIAEAKKISGVDNRFTLNVNEFPNLPPSNPSSTQSNLHEVGESNAETYARVGTSRRDKQTRSKPAASQGQDLYTPTTGNKQWYKNRLPSPKPVNKLSQEQTSNSLANRLQLQQLHTNLLLAPNGNLPNFSYKQIFQGNNSQNQSQTPVQTVAHAQ
ncbi:hypothetical protein QAD02_021720 [Eretmocerus hayati]|uniref:Uncharacterized protein n=1 Tax=Eretmocerus hayati TaxID=131215 RepID=A0ACC2PR91_9HYME|nr:hypothetical protein QAD02_021720 [Eretmocerus hayati]